VNIPLFESLRGLKDLKKCVKINKTKGLPICSSSIDITRANYTSLQGKVTERFSRFVWRIQFEDDALIEILPSLYFW
jgi:hypothetical protein